MSDLFRRIIPIILKNEGGYSNDPDDAGGETKFGICKKNYPSLDIKSLTVNEAIRIYYDDYWELMDMDYVKDENLALQLFDSGVNIGIRTAIKMLQRIVGVQDDGHLGPKTMEAVYDYPGDLVEEYKRRRKLFYVTLATRKPKNKKFLKGWLNRVNNTHF